jgi:hypothetical protein
MYRGGLVQAHHRIHRFLVIDTVLREVLYQQTDLLKSLAPVTVTLSRDVVGVVLGVVVETSVTTSETFGSGIGLYSSNPALELFCSRRNRNRSKTSGCIWSR